MRSETRTDSRLFGGLLRTLLREGMAVRFQAHGRSMYPAIADGNVVQVEPAATPAARGDVVVVETNDGLRLHRVTRSSANLRTRGDCCVEHDGEVEQLAGQIAIINDGVVRPVPRQRLGSIVRRWLATWRGHF